MKADTSKMGRTARAVSLSALIAAAAGAADQIDPDTYQRVVDENIALRQEQSRLTREAGELRKKNAALILDAQELENKRAQLAALVAQLKTPEDARGELERLQAERLLLVREVERLRLALSAAAPAPTNPPPPAAAPEQGSALFRKIEQENAELRQQLSLARETAQTAEKKNAAAQEGEAQYRGRAEKAVREMAALKKDLEQARHSEAAARKGMEKLARKSFQQQEEIGRLEVELMRQEEKARELARAGTAGMPVAANPGDTAEVLQAAGRALKSGRPKEAEKLYLEALSRTPSDALIHYNLGVVYGDYLKDAGKAGAHFRRYLELHPAARDASRVRSWLVELEIQAAR